MNHRDERILIKVLNEIEVANTMMAGNSFEAFNHNEMQKRAICMTVINIGELVKALSDEIRKNYRKVPWKAIAGFRDIAAHKYQTLKMEDVYLTVTEDFPELRRMIKAILEESNGDNV
jgi:uncharacterized protein with HEPN domain